MSKTLVGAWIPWLSVVAVLIWADQLLKSLIFGSVELGNKFVGTAHYRNPDLVFGLPVPDILAMMFVWVALTGLGSFVACQWSGLNQSARLAGVLVLSGGVVNLYERVVFGAVRDPIRIASSFWNLADWYIILGIVILLFSYQGKHWSR